MDATSIISAWEAVVSSVCGVFTEPTARTWRQVAMGWVMWRGPAAVTSLYRTLAELADRHWTVYEKFFYRARWSLQALSVQMIYEVVYPLIVESGLSDAQTGKPVADLAMDETTVVRYGKHVAHAGWHKDASASSSSHKGTMVHWGHCWLIGAVTLRLPRWGLLRWALPVVFRLYRPASDCRKPGSYKQLQTLVCEMMETVVEQVPGVQWRFSADGNYACREVLRAVPAGTNLVCRIRRNAALFEPVTTTRKSRKGPPRKKGKRLPYPFQMAARRRKGWQTITIQYQDRTAQRDVLGITCLWYKVCKDRPIRLAIVRDPSGRGEHDYLFCSDAKVSDQEIVQRYCDRWGVEEANRESKNYLGFESTQGWCSKTVNRQAPLAMVLLTLVKAWYAQVAPGEPALQPQATPWNRKKKQASFADMLFALRRTLWQHRFFATTTSKSGCVKKVRSSLYGLFAAA